MRWRKSKALWQIFTNNELYSSAIGANKNRWKITKWQIEVQLATNRDVLALHQRVANNTRHPTTRTVSKQVKRNEDMQMQTFLSNAMLAHASFTGAQPRWKKIRNSQLTTHLNALSSHLMRKHVLRSWILVDNVSIFHVIFNELM